MHVLLYLNGYRAAADVYTGLTVRLDTVLKSSFVHERQWMCGCMWRAEVKLG